MESPIFEARDTWNASCRLICAGIALVLVIAFVFAGEVKASIQPPPGVLTSATSNSPIIALTFDDGPSSYTPRILSVLRRFWVPATFFVVGTRVVDFPGIVRMVVRAGDELGNHTFNRLDLQSLSTPDVVAQLARDQREIHRVTGVLTHWFRPPFGDVDARIIGIAGSLRLRTVMGSVDPLDDKLPGVRSIVAGVLSTVRPGSIVIMHDGGGNRSQTVAALPIIIRALKARGYRFATLDQLFGLAPLAPCVPGAPARFAGAGVKAFPHHAIFRSWAALLCRGIDLGPATSPEFAMEHGVAAQDFRETAHRLVLLSRTGHVRVAVVWQWAVDAFSSHGVKPRYRYPITHAWFRQFLAGHDWGPALGPEKRYGRYLVQRFLHGWGRERPDGTVAWQRRLNAG